MSKVLILGGGGMIGQKLAHHLAAEGLNGDRDIAVTLFDMGFPLFLDFYATTSSSRLSISPASAR